MILVRILHYWYTSQLFCIKWSNVTSTFFNTSNGVRQGGILSPKLFAIYIDDLSVILSQLNVGCFINDTCMNHLFYADDMCLMAPSPSGIQTLIQNCEGMG